jgi:hypothetical protein
MYVCLCVCVCVGRQHSDEEHDSDSGSYCAYTCDPEDCYQDESCLCAGVSLLAGLLCRMYSETDDDTVVHMKR